MSSTGQDDTDDRSNSPGLMGSVVFFVGGLLFLGWGLVILNRESDLMSLVVFGFGIGAMYFGGRGLGRQVVDWYRIIRAGGHEGEQRPGLTGIRVSVAGLVLANLVPLVGVVLLGWNIASLLLIYWLENGLVGIVFLAKIRRAKGDDDSTELPAHFSSYIGKSKRAIAAIFLMHYGGFWLGHGVFVLLFAFLLPDLGPVAPNLAVVAVLGFAVHHYVSYRVNYLGEGEYERLGPIRLTVEPYYRVMVLHFTILFVGFAIGFAGGSVIAVGVMVLMKTVFDLGAHLREHAKAH